MDVSLHKDYGLKFVPAPIYTRTTAAVPCFLYPADDFECVLSHYFRHYFFNPIFDDYYKNLTKFKIAEETGHLHRNAETQSRL